MRHNRATAPREIPIIAPSDKVEGGAGLSVELEIGDVVVIGLVSSSAMVLTMLDTSLYLKKITIILFKV